MIRVAIADDQVLLRDMLGMILVQDSDIEVVGLAGNGVEILEICRREKPDVVLLDIRMPSFDGIYALERLKKEIPRVKVIMLTTFGDERNVLESYKKGADGYVLKDIKPHVLAMTVKSVVEGLCVMHEGVSELIRGRVRIPSTTKGAELEALEELHDEYGLNALDRKIIRLLLDGKSNREIGEALSYSEGTVKNRISNILTATGLKDRTQIAVFALQNNLI